MRGIAASFMVLVLAGCQEKSPEEQKEVSAPMRFVGATQNVAYIIATLKHLVEDQEIPSDKRLEYVARAKKAVHYQSKQGEITPRQAKTYDEELNKLMRPLVREKLLEKEDDVKKLVEKTDEYGDPIMIDRARQIQGSFDRKLEKLKKPQPEEPK